VRVLDAESGADAEIEKISWYCKPPPDVRGSGLSLVHRDPGELFKFQAPSGDVIIDTMSDAYRSVYETVNVHPGPNEITLRIERACGVQIDLKEGGAPVPWDWSTHRIVIRQKDGPGTQEGSGNRGNVFRSTVSQPGTYEVGLEPISGYEPVPAQVVEVKPKEFTNVTITLVPSK
jgi:hypothetical protein